MIGVDNDSLSYPSSLEDVDVDVDDLVLRLNRILPPV
jgi:hypothetical protein